MMDHDHDIRGLIAIVIREETQFLRHYWGKVASNLDELKKGRVLVTIDELGFDTPDIGMWCSPRQGNSLSVPQVDEFVEVYFIAGDPDRPVYLHYASEMSGLTPRSFDGKPTTRILFESPKTNEHIKYDDLLKQLDIISTTIKMNEGTEPLVLGNKLVTFLTGLLNELATHIHNTTAVVGGGGAVGVVSAPTLGFSPLAGDEISTEIFGK